MSSFDDNSTSRRRFLIGAMTGVSAIGVVGAAVPFVGSWFPNAKARAAGAPVRVNISKLEAGSQMVVEWRGQPVIVMRRTPENLKDLDTLDSQVADPNSQDSVQPEYVNTKMRSIKDDIIVLVGLCTHLGCSPTFRPEVAPADLGSGWRGGYFCPCHGSRYDLAGRVFKSQPAPLNLPVPPHSYESDDILTIGVDTKQV